MLHAALALGLLGVATACHPRPPSTANPSPSDRPGAEPSASEPASSCQRWPGPPGDVDLRGLPRTDEVRCCPSRYGLDPQQLVAACGLAAYLGESEELACVHRFAAEDGSVQELRLTALPERSFAEAVGLLASHELGPERVAEAPSPGLWWSASAGRRWALVDGWSAVRRLSWDEAACAPERMLPVLEAMAAAPDDGRPAVALPRVVGSAGASPAASPAATSLLGAAPTEPGPGQRFPLPRAAPALAMALVAAAAAEDGERFAALLAPDARLGLPDRRQLGARSIAGDLGLEQARQLFAEAAARLPASAPLRCPQLDRRARPQVARGEAWMWCFWLSEDGLDLLSLGLRGQIDAGEADGRVAYLGVFPTRPLAPVIVPGEPPPPPIAPLPPIDCRDPHARSHYPDLCPAPEPDPDELDASDEPEP